MAKKARGGALEEIAGHSLWTLTALASVGLSFPVFLTAFYFWARPLAAAGDGARAGSWLEILVLACLASASVGGLLLLKVLPRRRRLTPPLLVLLLMPLAALLALLSVLVFFGRLSL